MLNAFTTRPTGRLPLAALALALAAGGSACGGGSQEKDTGESDDTGGGGADVTPEVADEPDVGPDLDEPEVDPPDLGDTEVDPPDGSEPDVPVAPPANFNSITSGGAAVASERYFGIIAIGAPGPTTGALSPRFEVNVIPGSTTEPPEGSGSGSDGSGAEGSGADGSDEGSAP